MADKKSYGGKFQGTQKEYQKYLDDINAKYRAGQGGTKLADWRAQQAIPAASPDSRNIPADVEIPASRGYVPATGSTFGATPGNRPAIGMGDLRMAEGRNGTPATAKGSNVRPTSYNPELRSRGAYMYHYPGPAGRFYAGYEGGSETPYRPPSNDRMREPAPPVANPPGPSTRGSYPTNIDWQAIIEALTGLLGRGNGERERIR